MLPFQECGGALGKLSAGLISWVNDGRDLMVRQVVGDGVFEMGGKITEREVVALETVRQLVGVGALGGGTR